MFHKEKYRRSPNVYRLKNGRFLPTGVGRPRAGSDTRPLDLDQTPRSRQAQIEGSDTRYQSSVLIPLPALAEICERVGLVPRRR